MKATQQQDTIHIQTLYNQPTVTYASRIAPICAQKQPILMKQIFYLHGEPSIIWEEEQVEEIIINEDL